MEKVKNKTLNETNNDLGRADLLVGAPPKNVLLYGGGTQSTALLLMSLEGVFAKVDYAVFSKIGDSEPKFVNDYVYKVKEFVKDRYNFDLTILETSDLQKDILNANGNRVASLPYYTLNGTEKGMLMRQCTYEYKIVPINKWIKEKCNVQRGDKEVVCRWFGISFDEMQRMKTSTDKYAINYYPMVDARIRRAEAIDYINKRFPELKEPPRSSCVFCPFHSDGYWRQLKQKHPTEFQRAVEFDKQVRKSNPKLRSELYLHKSCKPLDEIDFDSQADFFEGCDEGYCGM